MNVVAPVKPTPTSGARQAAAEPALPAITHAASHPCLYGRGWARNHAREMLEAARRG